MAIASQTSKKKRRRMILVGNTKEAMEKLIRAMQELKEATDVGAVTFEKFRITAEAVQQSARQGGQRDRRSGGPAQG
jgi:adenine C2-methylase RlmN of 23S rRNA A2503 and tRNA A37